MKVIRLLLVISGVLLISSCASYQTDMNSSVPNENDAPLKNNMPPMNNGNINMN